MKYINVNSVVESYIGFQDCMSNKSWGYLALLKGCESVVVPLTPYEVNMDVVSNFLEGVFNLSQHKKVYDGGRSLYVVFSKKWDEYFNDQGRFQPNIYDIAIWSYRRKSFSDNASIQDVIKEFAKEFNIPNDIISKSFNTQLKAISFSKTLYTESVLKEKLKEKGVDVSKDNIDAKKSSVVASPGEISRGPFVQTLYAGLDITDYVLILQSDYKLLYDNSSSCNNNRTEYTHKTAPLQQIFYGAPGTGKSNTIKREVDEKGLPNVRTTFHPDSDYSTFVGAYKPTSIEVPVMTNVGTKAIPTENPDGTPRTEKKIVYEFVPQAFLKAYTEAWKNQDKPFFLIIEEINRGNCAQIFGDLFQLLDRNDDGESDYPITPDEDIQKFLLEDKTFGFASLTAEQEASIPEGIRKGRLLKLPKNLYIWATMNTSDQSLFPIDSAFKRRWDWQYMPIANGRKGWQIEAGGNRYDWWEFVQKVNEKIARATHSEDKKLGYFFCKPKGSVIDAATFVGKVVFYIWNDVFKDFAEDGDTLFKAEDGTLLSFDKFYTITGDCQTRVVESNVVQLLKNLGVEPVTVSDEAEEEDEEDLKEENQSQNSKGKYTLDGKQLSLGGIASKVVLNYANNYPEKSAKDIRDYFVGPLFEDVIISHLVETEEEYHSRNGQSSQKRSVTEIVIPHSNEKLYVSTQWRAKNDNDNFFKFMEIVNKEGLGNIRPVE